MRIIYRETYRCNKCNSIFVRTYKHKVIIKIGLHLIDSHLERNVKCPYCRSRRITLIKREKYDIDKYEELIEAWIWLEILKNMESVKSAEKEEN